eukprot:TRINITY_DN22896_c0_g1_i1.p1 TRINITY_DN22896_c0_g1~~TRINITY_DN22896_c0_g1_i1.p1  ORF type:complete len:159 (+),score=1.20 TRINITY_DN22896_c0_g1_i1:69-479(+)
MVDGKRASLSTKLNELSSGSVVDEMSLTINKTEIKISSSDTISTVISKINISAAGVNASYDEVSGEFSLTAKEFGSPKIEISQSNAESPLLQLLKIDPSDIQRNKEAQEAKVSIATKKQQMEKMMYGKSSHPRLIR